MTTHVLKTQINEGSPLMVGVIDSQNPETINTTSPYDVAVGLLSAYFDSREPLQLITEQYPYPLIKIGALSLAVESSNKAVCYTKQTATDFINSMPAINNFEQLGATTLTISRCTQDDLDSYANNNLVNGDLVDGFDLIKGFAIKNIPELNSKGYAQAKISDDEIVLYAEAAIKLPPPEPVEFGGLQV